MHFLYIAVQCRKIFDHMLSALMSNSFLARNANKWHLSRRDLLATKRIQNNERLAGVDFINKLSALFLPISFYQKVTKPNCNERKDAQFASVGKTHVIKF